MLKAIETSYGADPEIFLKRNGEICGSERIIPKNGLGPIGKPIVVRDGVQVELNPKAGASVHLLAEGVADSFRLLGKQTRKFGADLCWDEVVEVSPEEHASLSDESRILGCQPSENIYGDRPIGLEKKERETIRKRSAGGHLHFGLTSSPIFDERKGYDHRKKLISLFDIFVGNSLVLIDRDAGAADRRVHYGRAGEYRLQAYGIEYRTPSNFWLRNFSLMSLVYSLTDVAIHVLAGDMPYYPSTNVVELTKTVNIFSFIEAIDKNDFKLAERNFNTIRPFLAKHLPEKGYQLSPSTLDKFLVFAHGVRKNGLTAYFPDDPVDHWTGHKFEDFRLFLARI